MSHTSIYTFKADGTYKEVAEFGNAWGSAPMIWVSLFERWATFDPRKYENAISNPDKVWALSDDERIPLDHRVVLISTYDKRAVRKADLPALAKLYRQFHAAYLVPEGKTMVGGRMVAYSWSHLPAMADKFEELAKTDIEGVFVWWTSVSGDHDLIEQKERKDGDYDYRFAPERIVWLDLKVP